jgi:transcriptional regulator with XRE-family HTH domain
MRKLRERRRELNLTMKQLGRIVGVSEAAISHYETGKREPDPQMLYQLAAALGVTTDYLIENKASGDEVQKMPNTDRRAEGKALLNQMTDEEYERALAVLKLLR